MSSSQRSPSSDIDSEKIARYCKYYIQLNNPYVKWKLPLARISAKSFLDAHRRECDALNEIVHKYNIDAAKYIQFYVDNINTAYNDVGSDFISMSSFNRYIGHLKIQKRYEEIYSWFQKSVKNIAYDCVKLGIPVKDYLLKLIKSRKLAEYYLAGKISKYYLAAMPKFKQIIERMDDVSRQEFSTLHSRFDLYSKQINEACLKLKSQKANPIKTTEEYIARIKSKI